MDFINIANNNALLNIIETNIGEAHFNKLKFRFNEFAKRELESIDENLVDYLRLLNYYSQQLDKMKILDLPSYEGHQREVIIVNNNNIDLVIKEILKERFLGFDTESKPNFRKGSKRNKISLIQISTTKKCYLFQMFQIKDKSKLKKIIENRDIFKIGVGLGDDKIQLRVDFHYAFQSIIDLSILFHKLGRKNRIGSKQLVAIVLNKNLRKSKKMSTSNWEKKELSKSQILYASDDAFSALDSYLELKKILSPYKKYMSKEILEILTY